MCVGGGGRSVAYASSPTSNGCTSPSPRCRLVGLTLLWLLYLYVEIVLEEESEAGALDLLFEGQLLGAGSGEEGEIAVR